MRFAIVTSSFNPEVTSGLRQGAVDELKRSGIQMRDEDQFTAPGAFEIPLIAETLAKTGQYDGIICLGCVIKGDTAHFEFISLGATIGIQNAMSKTGIPISFGILTTYTDEQALIRSKQGPENKGREAAIACRETAFLLKKIR